MDGAIYTGRSIGNCIAIGWVGGQEGLRVNPTSIRECLRISPRVFGIPNALSPDMIPVIARATKASMEEAGVQGRDEKAAATQGPPHKKRLLDEGSVQVVEEDAVAPAPSSLPPGEPAGVMLCLPQPHQVSHQVSQLVCCYACPSPIKSPTR